MLEKVKHINLPKVEDARGNLSILEENINVPFTIKRAYWIYDVPGGEKRFGHAFKKQHEFIVALSGSFDVILNDGNIPAQSFILRNIHTQPDMAAYRELLHQFRGYGLVIVEIRRKRLYRRLR